MVQTRHLGRHLLANSRDEPKKTGYLHLEYLKELQSSSRVPHMRLIHAANRLFSQILSYLTCIDVCSHSDLETRIDWSSPEDVKHLKQYNPVIGWKLFPGPITIALRWLGVRPFKSSAWKQRQRHLWISRLVRVLYFSFNFHVLVNLHFQYSYDFDRIKLIAMGKQLQEKQRNRDDTSELELNMVLLTNRSHETKLMLDLIGAPNSNWGFTVESVYIYTIICAVTMHYIASFYHSVVTQFDIHIGRELLDGENEGRHFDEMIRLQVSKYIESHKIFSEVSISRGISSMSLAVNQAPIIGCAGLLGHADQLAHCRHTHQTDRYQAGGSGLISMRTIEARLNKDLLDSRNNLNLMLTLGAMKPYNKAPSHIDRRSLLMTAYFIYLGCFGTALISWLIYWSLACSDPSRPLNLRDLLLLISVTGLLGIGGVSINLLTTYFSLACLDQIVAANKVRELIMRCIEINYSDFLSFKVSLKDRRQLREHHQQHNQLLLPDKVAADEARGPLQGGSRQVSQQFNHGRAHKPCSSADIMNTNLLFVLMQYKIFVAQYLPFKRTFKSFIVYMTVFSVAMPLLLRIHLAYMNAFNLKDICTFIVIWTVGTLPLADINSVPVCHLYSRCVDLYRALFSLSAHIAAIESEPKGRGLYDAHAVTTLIKELEHPRRLMDQFKSSALGLTCTYATLVKTQFWRGLIVLSILADKQFSEQGLFGSIFRDPFGLF